MPQPSDQDIHEFIETAKDTNGQRVTLKTTLKTKGQVVPRHFHVLQDETFEVVSGRMTIISGSQTTLLLPGEKITLPRHIPHNHFNNEDSPLTYIHTITPALDFEYLIQTLAGLTADGKSKNGKYGFVQQLVILKYLDSKSYLADIPVGIQKVLMNTIGPVGRLWGYRAVYKKYSGIEK